MISYMFLPNQRIIKFLNTLTGKYYLKVGHMAVGECEVTSKEQYKAWYCGQGESETTDRLSKLVHEIFPG